MRRISGLGLIVAGCAGLAVLGWWVLAERGTEPTRVDPGVGAATVASKVKSRSRTVELSRPVPTPASIDNPDDSPDDPVWDAAAASQAAAQAELDERLEIFQQDVQRAEACEILFDRHVEPFLRVEERLLSEALQGPEHLERRLSLLDTFEEQIVEVLDKGNCP